MGYLDWIDEEVQNIIDNEFVFDDDVEEILFDDDFLLLKNEEFLI